MVEFITQLSLRHMDTSTLDFELLAQSFLNHCAVERGLAKNSIEAYRRDLTKFSIFLGSKPLIQVNASLILEFETTLRLSKMSTTSINRIESTLRTFFRHLQIEHSLPNPTLEIVTGKSARRLPKALEIDRIVSLIEAALQDGEPMTLRDHAMIEVLYGSGARVSELIAINLNDINVIETDEGEITTLHLRGKGGKERIVPLGSFATKSIENYVVRIRPTLCAKNSISTTALFLNARGRRLTRQTAWNIVVKAAKRAGIEEVVTPHVFRHSYATHLLDGGADIRIVQELLGHASVTTTQIYTLITIDKIRESYATAHPRS